MSIIVVRSNSRATKWLLSCTNESMTIRHSANSVLTNLNSVHFKCLAIYLFLKYIHEEIRQIHENVFLLVKNFKGF